MQSARYLTQNQIISETRAGSISSPHILSLNCNKDEFDLQVKMFEFESNEPTLNKRVAQDFNSKDY